MEMLTAQIMRKGLEALDSKINRPLTLIIGGGGAMLLAYNFPLATADIDAAPQGMTVEEIDPLIKVIALELDLPGDWLNPWYSSFTHVLPQDYASRLIEVFRGQHLHAKALGKEDLLLMKCFAHRAKDIPHARALLRAKARTEIVYDRIEELLKRKIPHAQEALDFLDEMIDMEEG